MTAPSHRPRPTRAAFLTGGGLALLAAASACSSGPSDADADGSLDAGSGSDSGSDDRGEGEGTTSYPLTLATPYGETVLEAVPERIAVVGGLGDLEVAVALGLAPVLAPWTVEDLGWLVGHEEAMAEAEKVEIWGDSFPYEMVAAAQPDLIVAQTLDAVGDHYERLAEIAPVLARDSEEEYGRTDKDWRELVRGLAAAVDRIEAGESAITDAEQHIAEVAARHPEYEGRTLAILINRGQEYGIEMVNLAGTTTEELLDTLGFAPHPHAGEVTEPLSLENLSLADADLLVIHQHGGADEPEVAARWLESSELYQRLTAVSEGAVGHTDVESTYGWCLPWGLSWPDPLGLPYIVDQLEGVLDELLDA
ncbi:ABC transporter substrate-binding protein [Brachybacterium sp. AOP43-C2-M15]|uniref:ABC transporter substrate-binding protein n=1 Tax=Brachybacterium sp. AOP43-C2-M15 TaxID=3457661 RepID=UPI0040331E0C